MMSGDWGSRIFNWLEIHRGSGLQRRSYGESRLNVICDCENESLLGFDALFLIAFELNGLIRSTSVN